MVVSKATWIWYHPSSGTSRLKICFCCLTQKLVELFSQTCLYRFVGFVLERATLDAGYVNGWKYGLRSVIQIPRREKWYAQAVVLSRLSQQQIDSFVCKRKDTKKTCRRFTRRCVRGLESVYSRVFICTGVRASFEKTAWHFGVVVWPIFVYSSSCKYMDC